MYVCYVICTDFPLYMTRKDTYVMLFEKDINWQQVVFLIKKAHMFLMSIHHKSESGGGGSEVQTPIHIRNRNTLCHIKFISHNFITEQT